MKKNTLFKVFALLLSFSLGWEIPRFSSTPSFYYLAPASKPLDENVLREVEKVGLLTAFLDGRAQKFSEEGSPSLLIFKGTFPIPHAGNLTVDSERVIAHWQKTGGTHGPYFYAVLDPETKPSPDLFFETAKYLNEQINVTPKKFHPDLYVFIRHFLGAAIHFSSESSKQKKYDEVTSFLTKNQRLIPKNLIDTNKKQYTPSEYASMLDWEMLTIADFNGNLERWNEQVDDPSKLPDLLKKLKEAKNPEERAGILKKIRAEYERLDKLYAPIERGRAVGPNDTGEPFAADTVVFPRKGEKTAIPLKEGLDFATYIRSIFQSASDSLPEITGKPANDPDLDALRARLAKKAEKIIEAKEVNSRGQLVLSRENLDEIGAVLEIQRWAAVLKGFGGKGTRFKVREYQNGKRQNPDRAKGSYIISMLGNKTILELDFYSLQDFERNLVRRSLGPSFDVVKERLPEVLVQSHITHADLSAIYEDRLLLPATPITGKSGKLSELFPQGDSPLTGSKMAIDTPARPLITPSNGCQLPLVEDDRCLWPDGHNSAFVDYYISGAAFQHAIHGVRYYFVSNCDNLVALPQPAKLALLALTGRVLMNDVAEKEPGMKGGSLIKTAGAPPRKTKSTENRLMLYEGSQMPLMFMEIVDAMQNIAKEKNAPDIFTNPDFLFITEQMNGTKDPEDQKVKSGLVDILNKNKVDPEVIQPYEEKVKRGEGIAGAMNTKYKLFNTANYLAEIKGLLSAYNIDWSEYKDAIEKGLFHPEAGSDMTPLEMLRRRMKDHYPILLEKDKTFDEMSKEDKEKEKNKMFDGAVQMSQLAGAVTGIVPPEKLLYLEVPSGQNAGEESLFQPLKNNVETYVKDVEFLKALMEDERNVVSRRLVDCDIPSHRENPNFIAEFDEWVGSGPIEMKEGKPWRKTWHKDFDDYRGKNAQGTLGVALNKAEENLTKHRAELEIVSKVLSRYKQSDIVRIAKRKMNTAVVLMAGGEQTRMGSQAEPKILTPLPAAGDQTLLNRIMITLKLNGLGGMAKRRQVYIVSNSKNQNAIGMEMRKLKKNLRMNSTQVQAVSDIEDSSSFVDSVIAAAEKAKEEKSKQVLVLMGDVLPDASQIGLAVHTLQDQAVILASGRGGHTFYDPEKHFPLSFNPQSRSGLSLIGFYFPVSSLDTLKETRDLSQVFPRESTAFIQSEMPVYNLNTPAQVYETSRSFRENPRPFGIKTDGLIPKALARLALAEVVPKNELAEYELTDISSGMRKTVFSCHREKRANETSEPQQFIVEIFTPYMDGESRYQASKGHHLVYGYKTGRIFYYNDDLRILVRENLAVGGNKPIEVALRTMTDIRIPEKLMVEAAHYIRMLQRKEDFEEAGPLNFETNKPLGRGKRWFNGVENPIIYPMSNKNSSSYFGGYLAGSMEKMIEAFDKAGLKVPVPPEVPDDPKVFFWSHGSVSPGNMVYSKEKDGYQIRGVTGGDMMMIAPAERDLAIFLARLISTLVRAKENPAIQNGAFFNLMAGQFLDSYYAGNPPSKASLERLRYHLFFDLLMEAWTVYFEKESGNLNEKDQLASLYLELARRLSAQNEVNGHNLFGLKDNEYFYSLLGENKRLETLANRFGVVKVDMSPRIVPGNKIVLKPGESKTVTLQVYVPGARETKEMRNDKALQNAIVRRIHTLIQIRHNGQLQPFKGMLVDKDFNSDKVNYSFTVEISDLDPGLYEWRALSYYREDPSQEMLFHLNEIYPYDSEAWGSLEVRDVENGPSTARISVPNPAAVPRVDTSI